MLEHSRVICRLICFNRPKHLRGSSALKQGPLSMLRRLGGSSTLEQGSTSMLEHFGGSTTLDHTSTGVPGLEQEVLKHKQKLETVGIELGGVYQHLCESEIATGIL